MNELLQEIAGLRDEINTHEWSDLEADRYYLGSRMILVLDLMAGVVRNSQTVVDHKHRLHGEEHRTGPVIPHGY